MLKINFSLIWLEYYFISPVYIHFLLVCFTFAPKLYLGSLFAWDFPNLWLAFFVGIDDQVSRGNLQNTRNQRVFTWRSFDDEPFLGHKNVEDELLKMSLIHTSVMSTMTRSWEYQKVSIMRILLPLSVIRRVLMWTLHWSFQILIFTPF